VIRTLNFYPVNFIRKLSLPFRLKTFVYNSSDEKFRPAPQFNSGSLYDLVDSYAILVSINSLAHPYQVKTFVQMRLLDCTLVVVIVKRVKKNDSVPSPRVRTHTTRRAFLCCRFSISSCSIILWLSPIRT
jgi:hypothetical protein